MLTPMPEQPDESGATTRHKVRNTRELHICSDCGCESMYPREWIETEYDSWDLTLHCPNCYLDKDITASSELVDAYDLILTEQTEGILETLYALRERNMGDWVTIFCYALRQDGILPEDFDF